MAGPLYLTGFDELYLVLAYILLLIEDRFWIMMAINLKKDFENLI